MLPRSYGLDQTHWYVPPTAMTPIAKELFMQLGPDQMTQDFMDKSAEVAGNYFWQTIRNVGVMFLSMVYSKTDINGITGFGNMFLFSEEQIATFLDINRSNWIPENKKVLDLGAGNGDITENLRSFYQQVYATELSSKMQKRLVSKGFTLLDAVKWDETDIQFDLITAFNLLDRHYSPRKLLHDLWKVASRSKCNVVISLVLPVNHYVEFNPNGTSTRPDIFLNAKGTSYTDHVDELIKNEFAPANFQVLRWTRLPYLCEGDMNHSAYYLPDAVFLLKPINRDENQPANPSNTPATATTNSKGHEEL